MEERPSGLDVTVRVRRDRLDMFLRLTAFLPSEFLDDDGESEWATVRLTYGLLPETRQLLVFGDQVEVLSPPRVREELARAAASVTELYQRSGEAPG
ncbi:hypothetical protein STAFG_7864 [Streptomyces afghaniensis 772]|uniref:WCX domain-containing protein n=1 Tax=Streptomyces afghaniensis 772 TaxID=1283301 RepID=S4NAM2_9ACTN|nr:hypothetical protein STAFG_7864 [Streptomyces afghaniensis 772]